MTPMTPPTPTPTPTPTPPPKPTTATTRPTPPAARTAVTWQVVRFALVGAVNTGTYYGLYLLFGLRLPYIAAHVLAFALSMVGSFFLTSYFTYRTRPTWRKFLLFPLTNAANFVITTVGVYVLVDLLSVDSTYAPLIAAAAAIPVTFLLSRTIMLGPDTTRTRESLTETVASK